MGAVVWATRRALNLDRPHTAFSRVLRYKALFSSASDQTGEIDEINSKFAEAREEIELALESKETVYFDEEARTARDAVQLVLDKYKALLERLPDLDKGSLQRSMGLKMEQLKAELEQLNT